MTGPMTCDECGEALPLLVTVDATDDRTFTVRAEYPGLPVSVNRFARPATDDAITAAAVEILTYERACGEGYEIAGATVQLFGGAAFGIAARVLLAMTMPSSTDRAIERAPFMRQSLVELMAASAEDAVPDNRCLH